jgi:phospholipid/cholesterol/gamma-HCH transport system permease protein
LEFAPIGAGLIVAGRSGASLGAEIGSMKLTEQIDALEVQGLSSIKELVGPRVLACVIALPLLTLTITYIALASGALAAHLSGTLDGRIFYSKMMEAFKRPDVAPYLVPATLKTMVFGYLIAVAGCHAGLQAHGGTEGVGRAATRGVVRSIFLVLVANVALVRLIQLLILGR